MKTGRFLALSIANEEGALSCHVDRWQFRVILAPITVFLHSAHTPRDAPCDMRRNNGVQGWSIED